MEERQHTTESGSYCFWSTKAICMDFETGTPLGMLEEFGAGEAQRLSAIKLYSWGFVVSTL
jgi:hypothetical protein